MEKAQALVAYASQNAATEIAVARRGAFRPSALAASPVRVRACSRACVPCVRMRARVRARILQRSLAKPSDAFELLRKAGLSLP